MGKNWMWRGWGVVLALILVLVGCVEGQALWVTPTATTVVPTATMAPLPTATAVPQPYTIDGFKALVRQIEATRLGGRQAIVNQYLAGLRAAPLVTEREALFIWQGAGWRVQVVGDMNNWQQAAGDDLMRVEGTDLWYLEMPLPVGARLDYKLLIDERDWLLDPLNTRTIRGGFGPNSEVVMPQYEALPPLTVGVPAGTLTAHTLDSVVLGEKRTFFVYTPAGQVAGGAGYPSLYVQDGGDYLNIVDMTAHLDTLIGLGEIRPLVVVFIPPIQRTVEYQANDAYVAFLAEELVPWVREHYGTAVAATETGVMGSSLGGLLAVYAGLRVPDVFGLVLAQSGAYRLEAAAWEGLIAAGEGHGGRYYLVAGEFETAVAGDDLYGNIVAGQGELVDRFQRAGYQFEAQIYPQGHSWGLWRDTLGVGLRYLYEKE